jgi:hypothetical protein
MKRLSSLVLFFMVYLHGFSQTTINSDITINTTWTLANSPYLVESTVTIAENVTLTIEPGVVVKSNTISDMFIVNGTITAIGTISDTIVFTYISDDEYGGDSNNDGNSTTPSPGEWGSLRVKEASNNSSQFQFCLFRYGGRIDGVVMADNSSPQLENSRIELCKNGMEINGRMNPLVQNNVFEGIIDYPIIICPGSAAIFSGNSFINNTFTGIGLKRNEYTLEGESDTLKQMNIAGIENIPYLLDYRLIIDANTTIVAEAGIVLKANTISNLIEVNGTLITMGTSVQPVVFTHISDDAYGGDANNDGAGTTPGVGEWNSIVVNAGSTNSSEFQHCLFRYGGRIDGVLVADNSSPQVENCSFQSCDNGLEVNGRVNPLVQNNIFEGTGEYPVIICSGSNPIFSGNTFMNNTFTGIGLKRNEYTLEGDSDTLKQMNIAGIENIPYLLTYRLIIDANTTLTIEPGVILKAHTISDLMEVNGTLIANGTPEQPVVFTYISDDAYGGDANNDGGQTTPEVGEWNRIIINESSTNTSQFSNCLFRYGGRINGAMMAHNSSPQVEDCHFQYCDNGLEINGRVNPVVRNNVFEGTGEYPLIISPGSAPVFSGNSFNNNTYTGIGLKKNTYTLAEDSDTLKQITVAGIENISYLLTHRLIVDPNTTLIIEPGVVLKANTISDLLEVNGELIAEGTPEQPVVFTHISDDESGGDSNPGESGTMPMSGSWGSIQINDTASNGSSLKNCLIRYGGRINGALYVNASSPSLESVQFLNCQTGLTVENTLGLKVNNLEFMQSGTGLDSRITGGVLEVDSSFFIENMNAIEITTGDASVNYSEFGGNTGYDIANNTPNTIDATNNYWGNETLLEIIESANPKKLNKLYDFYDDGSLGVIDYSDFIIPENEVISVSPDIGVTFLDTGSVTIIAYPVLQSTEVIFYNELNGPWTPDSVQHIDSIRIKTYWDYSLAQKGRYDVILINGSDSIIMKEGFALVESATPFGDWSVFEEPYRSVYTSSVVLPAAGRIYCLIKKTTHIGYSSTWRGGVDIYKNNEIIATHSKSSEDIVLMLENVEAGYYSFDISSDYDQPWGGEIKFCIEPDTAIINEWNQGLVLRPYGADWKVFEVNNTYDELTFQTQGYGLWSTLEVYYDYIGNKSLHWFFNNSGKGYSITGSVQNPPIGKYYLKYDDSAVLWEGSSYDDDQSREYLINVSTSGLQKEPVQPVDVIKLSTTTFGQGYSTLEITGKGLSDSVFVQLYNNSDTILPVRLSYNSDLQMLVVDLNFSVVDTGSYYLNIVNDSSDYIHPAQISVVAFEWEPVGVQIIANEKYRVGRYQTVIVKITNHSNSNIRNGYVSVNFENENVQLIAEEDFFSDVMLDTLRAVYRELDINKQFFIFSDLAPHKDIYIKMKMYSEETYDQQPFKLEVRSGRLDDQLYADILSLFNDTMRELLISGPFRQSLKDSVQALTPSDWNDINDSITHYLGIHPFVYNPTHDLLLKHSGQRQGRGTIITFGTYWLTGLCAVSNPAGIGGALADFGLGQLPGGLGLALSPSTAMLEGYKAVLSIWFKCIDALAGNEGGTPPKEETRELTWFVWTKSTTPEDKYGPVGASVEINDSLSNNFINTTEVFEYRIDYWNKEDATAPAAIVYIRDTIDTDFDLTTFNFTEIGFLRWTAPLEGGQYFKVDIDTRPDMPYIVRVEGTIDTETREAFWVHTALDTATMELTEDPEGGYLPPIDSTGYQIGWVSYSVESKKDLPDGSVFTNQAFVNFDGVGVWGPAPKEGPFTNTFDFTRPQSEVLGGTSNAVIDSANIEWTGSDIGSGIEDYTIYVSEGDEYTVWKHAVNDTSAWFKGEMGKTYSFYSIARDRVGNIEQKEALPEHTVSFLSSDINQLALRSNIISVYPNPSDGQFILELLNEKEHVQIIVFDMLGREIYSGIMREKSITLDLSDKPGGIYILNVNNDKNAANIILIKE